MLTACFSAWQEGAPTSAGAAGEEDLAVAEAAAEATERRSRFSLGGGKTPCSRVVDAHRCRVGLFGGDGGGEEFSSPIGEAG